MIKRLSNAALFIVLTVVVIGCARMSHRVDSAPEPPQLKLSTRASSHAELAAFELLRMMSLSRASAEVRQQQLDALQRDFDQAPSESNQYSLALAMLAPGNSNQTQRQGRESLEQLLAGNHTLAPELLALAEVTLANQRQQQAARTAQQRDRRQLKATRAKLDQVRARVTALDADNKQIRARMTELEAADRKLQNLLRLEQATERPAATGATQP